MSASEVSKSRRQSRREARVERRTSRKERFHDWFHAFLAFLEHKIHAKPGVFAVYILLRVLVVIEIVRAFIMGQYENVVICLLVLALFLLPSFLEHGFRVEVPSLLEIIILLFAFSAEILGEIGSFYTLIPFWDTMLHTLWGFLCGAIGFAVVDVIDRTKSTHVTLTPAFMAFVSVTFSMTISVFWEIFEYLMDNIVGFDMQKDSLVSSFGTVWLDPTQTNTVIRVDDIASTTITLSSGETIVIDGGYLDIGIHDTMDDLIVNLVGSIVFAIFGFKYVRARNAGDEHVFAANLIPRAAEGGAIWDSTAEAVVVDAEVCDVEAVEGASSAEASGGAAEAGGAAAGQVEVGLAKVDRAESQVETREPSGE